MSHHLIRSAGAAVLAVLGTLALLLATGQPAASAGKDTTTPLAELDLSPGRSYAFELRAVDAAGNRSVTPARLTFETTPPGVATGLRQVSTRAGFPERIEWTAAPDNSGIQGYDVVLNGEVIGTTGRTVPEVDLFDLIFNIACIDPPSGPATLQVRAVDTSFNSGALSAPLALQFP